MTATELPHPIKARRVRFAWDATPEHWVPGDAQTSHTMNVLHLVLPAGEQWFVDVYREALPLVSDDRLHADVRGFMGQEAVHARSHAGVLHHLADQGIDTRPFTRQVEWLFGRALAAEPFGRRIPGPLRHRWLVLRVSLVAAIEQYTAVLGSWVLGAQALDRAGADPTMMDLLRWHGAEEVEHRSVAFDLFEHLDGGYLWRVAMMIPATVGLTGFWIRGVRYLMAHDTTTHEPTTWRRYFAAARDGRLPRLREVYAAVPRYLRRDHHPSSEGSTEQALAYLAASPAAQAAAAGSGSRPPQQA